MALLQIAEPGQSLAPHQRRVAVGIDLGTTNSLVAAMKNALPEVLGDEQGNAQAQASLGFMAQAGRGLTQDYAEAASWFQKSAEQGVADAQFMLGAFFRDGTGVEQDYSKAAFWFESAAEQGYARAQRNLGLLYRDGLGLTKDPIEAQKWFNLSAASGEELAKTNRDELAAKMAPAELDEAQRLASAWVKK